MDPAGIAPFATAAAVANVKPRPFTSEQDQGVFPREW